jgi:tRNA (guanine37-N1)-methyltransferase
VRFDLITLFPQMFAALTEFGVTARALKRELYTVKAWNPRDYTHDNHRTVDDRPYGGGPGMVMRIEPLRQAIHAAQSDANLPPSERRVICLSPQGAPLTQQRVAALAGYQQLILIAGRYEGIDERLLQLEVDEEISLGDYILSGGELAAMVVLDSVIRLLPGALGHADSANQDSFSDGLLDCPHYTRPECYEGLAVPPVLLSGDHQAIARWRRMQMLGRTAARRPDLLGELNEDDRRLLGAFATLPQGGNC